MLFNRLGLSERALKRLYAIFKQGKGLKRHLEATCASGLTDLRAGLSRRLPRILRGPRPAELP